MFYDSQSVGDYDTWETVHFHRGNSFNLLPFFFARYGYSFREYNTYICRVFFLSSFLSSFFLPCVSRPPPRAIKPMIEYIFSSYVTIGNCRSVFFRVSDAIWLSARGRDGNDMEKAVRSNATSRPSLPTQRHVHTYLYLNLGLKRKPKIIRKAFSHDPFERKRRKKIRRGYFLKKKKKEKKPPNP